MLLPIIIWFPSLLLVLLLAIATEVAPEPIKAKRKPDPIGDVIFEFLDKNHDKEVTIPEMNSQILMLGQMANEGGDQVDDDTKELRVIFAKLKIVAPYMFNLLDSDEDRRLDKYEAKYITTFVEAFSENDGAKDFVRECFEIFDDDVDDQLSVDEIFDGASSSFVIGELANSLHDLLPVRDYPRELKKHIKRAMKAMWGDELDKEGIAEGMKWWDSNGDGYIQMKEVGDVYNLFGEKLLGIANSINQMGSTLGMFGGGGGQKGDKGNKDNLADAFQQTNNIQSNVQSEMRMDL